jgi:hypothetical protein
MGMRIWKTPYHSYRTGELARGCRLCVKGLKEVLFVTGLCGQHCFFCPLSEQKKDRDVVYANEWPIKRMKEIVTESRLCDSKGAGITGGDPMLKLERTVKIIKMLKKRFGKEFHIHLYTPLPEVSLENLSRLHKAGLDEIRFHPELLDKKFWDRIVLARRFDWSVGVEIPLIPGNAKETRELIQYMHDKIDFLNLNELEISTTNADELEKRGHFAKSSLSYGVRGSEEMAIALLRLCQKLNLRTHYCTTTLKDRVQLAKRIKRRAKNAAQSFDRVTREGMLVRGAIYLRNLEPGFGYRKQIARADRKRALKSLNALRHSLTRRLGIPHSMVVVDHKKLRLLTTVSIAKRLAGRIENKCAIVEEYPTYDQFEVTVEVL